MKNYLDIRAFVLDIESKFPVNSWQVNGIHFWPILRIKLFFYLIAQINSEENNEVNKKAIPSSSSSFFQKVKSYTKKQLQKVSAIFGYYKWVNKLPSKKHVFVGAESHRVDYKGTKYNRFFDTLIDEYQLSSSALYLEVGKAKVKNQYQKDLLNKFNVPLQGFQYLKTLFKSGRKCNFSINEYHDFLNELSNNYQTAHFAELYSEVKIKQWLPELVSSIQFFKKVLKKINPEKVMILCYYSENVMALTAAANQLGIETIEMQHGPQAETHLAYGSWSSVPITGYDMLPRTYWCWDESSAKVSNKWASENKLYTTKVIGNPWIDYWKSKKESYSYSDFILYSLQPVSVEISIEDLFPKAVLAFIKEQPFKWFIRLHPRQMKQKHTLVSYLKKHHVFDLVNIEEATNDALPQLLANAKLHFTLSSGTTIEASFFNLTTVLIDKIGVHYYPDLVSNKKAFYLNPEATSFSDDLMQVLTDKQ